MTVDPSTLPRKDQLRLRAQLVREGTRTLAAAQIMDYRAAKPTHKPKPLSTVAPVGRAAAMEAIDALKESILNPEPASREGAVSAYSAAIAHATTPKPLPKPDTRHGLLARLNARHQH